MRRSRDCLLVLAGIAKRDQAVGLCRQIGQAPKNAGRVSGRRLERRVERIDRGDQRRIGPIDRLRAQGFTDQRQRISEAGDPAGVSDGRRDHLPAANAKRQEVPGEIAAIDRRNVFRIEGTQIDRVVPVVEMAAEALHLVHGREGRFEPVGRVDGS